ncbi:hypothetical protein ABIC09_003837 [Bradyrhizobium sp. S3.12.5]|uniref:SEC-C domain-containing protein n=1 Tax=Bradyrhizobium sp. S3.12.5 TaxID=3156386 RepID=UPI0033957457
MTLLLALSNERHSFLVADRRVTSNGLVQDDEFNKVTVLFCDDARVALAFTGLACCSGFNTRTWLWEALSEIGKTQHEIHSVLKVLESKATSAFSRPPISNLPLSDRRLAILVTGFVYRQGARSSIVFCMSNFDTPYARFTIEMFPERRVFVKAAGCLSSLSESDLAAVEEILQSDVAGDAIERKAVRLIQRLAASNGLIGKQCNSAVIPGDADTVVTSTYHSAHITQRAYGADVVFALSCGPWAIAGPEIMSAGMLSGPPIRSNQTCWCGSGKRFKHCHKKTLGSVYAKLPMFREPLPWGAMQLLPDDVPSLASGRCFRVSSAFR